MASLDTWAESLTADLKLEFPDADVMHGERTGRATDRARITVFWAGDIEFSSAVVAAQARLIVRYWPVTAKLRDDAPAGVRDPSELMAARASLKAFLEGKQTAYPSTGVWFSRLVRVTPDYDPGEWGVEGELLLMFTNEAVVA